MLKVLDSEKEFESVVKDGKWLVDFYAEWCGPCKMLIPVLEKLAEDVNILKVDTDKFTDLAANFGIMSIPTLILFENGKVISQTIGYKNIDELKKFVQ